MTQNVILIKTLLTFHLESGLTVGINLPSNKCEKGPRPENRKHKYLELIFTQCNIQEKIFNSHFFYQFCLVFIMSE